MANGIWQIGQNVGKFWLFSLLVKRSMDSCLPGEAFFQGEIFFHWELSTDFSGVFFFGGDFGNDLLAGDVWVTLLWEGLGLIFLANFFCLWFADFFWVGFSVLDFWEANVAADFFFLFSGL